MAPREVLHSLHSRKTKLVAVPDTDSEFLAVPSGNEAEFAENESIVGELSRGVVEKRNPSCRPFHDSRR